MAKKPVGPQMILANCLREGRALFFGRDGAWHAEPALADVAEGDGLDALMAKARAFADANNVIDPVFIPAEQKDDHYYPAHIKHVMQAKGPSVRPDLGYQVSPDWERR
ncbi:hypothetical protein GCM10017044_09440 [Kordiimonas sediminis]|uniref:DUF2849 domain-containing protein n=1 Tax=Kordiimonas sediminis TaxID=1735581 RepID=A0A919ANK4_9PROT|nr:DUF2849 domain-containing protein [Kordiimonas sediminis]GHF17185.1 hypothetical protein GCM10017044_09440 [Kordiimonas sediminis]